MAGLLVLAIIGMKVCSRFWLLVISWLGHENVSFLAVQGVSVGGG